MTKNPALYILMRTDMESLTPGKAMAQAAHAANQFQSINIRDEPTSGSQSAEWFNQGNGFGTTIVLGVDSEREMWEIVQAAIEDDFEAGVVMDSSYPLRDGKVVHLLPVNTCAYIFTPCRDKEKISAIAGLSLHK